MNKSIDALIPMAYEVLEEVKIVEQDEDDKKYILKAYRGQIASFGSSIRLGSLSAAIAFFSDMGGADVHRDRLMEAIWLLLQEERSSEDYKADALFWEVKNQENQKIKQKVLNCAVALKLAMNLYELRDKKKEEEDAKSELPSE